MFRRNLKLLQTLAALSSDTKTNVVQTLRLSIEPAYTIGGDNSIFDSRQADEPIKNAAENAL